MLLLALDTSTRLASVALCSEAALLGEYTWYVDNNHSIELLERIRRLCSECGQSLSALAAVAVATGPGSFNGLRVAVATAKALAFALHTPVVGIATLDGVAAQQWHWPGIMCPVLEAGRGEVYAACYTWRRIAGAADAPGRLERLSDYMLLAPRELVNYIHERAGAWPGLAAEQAWLFCGELSETSLAAIQETAPVTSVFAYGILSARHASTLALLALQRLRAGHTEDPLLLEPLYLRRPSITTSARKQPLLGSGDISRSAEEAT